MTNKFITIVGSAVIGAALLAGAPDAKSQVYGINVQSTPFGADLDVYLQSTPFGADKDVYVAGQCRGTGSTDIYVQSTPFGADEDWYVQSSPVGADMDICLSGDLDEWFEHSN